MMEQEVGDGTNFVIILAGELLKQAEDLVRKFIFLPIYNLAMFQDRNCTPQACCPWVCRVCQAHPDFGRSVNPISTRGDRLCPPNYYWHTRIYRPSDGPAPQNFFRIFPDS